MKIYSNYLTLVMILAPIHLTSTPLTSTVNHKTFAITVNTGELEDIRSITQKDPNLIAAYKKAKEFAYLYHPLCVLSKRWNYERQTTLNFDPQRLFSMFDALLEAAGTSSATFLNTPVLVNHIGTYPPLVLVIGDGNEELATHMVKNGANVNVPACSASGKQHASPLMAAVDFRMSPEFIQFLLQQGAYAPYRSKTDNSTALTKAKRNAHEQAEKILMEHLTKG